MERAPPAYMGRPRRKPPSPGQQWFVARRFPTLVAASSFQPPLEGQVMTRSDGSVDSSTRERIGSRPVRIMPEYDFCMNIEQLNELQAPLEKYRETPDAAVITLTADGTLDQIATLLKLTERYCVVAQSLRQPPTFSISRHA